MLYPPESYEILFALVVGGFIFPSERKCNIEHMFDIALSLRLKKAAYTAQYLFESAIALITLQDYLPPKQAYFRCSKRKRCNYRPRAGENKGNTWLDAEFSQAFLFPKSEACPDTPKKRCLEYYRGRFIYK